MDRSSQSKSLRIQIVPEALKDDIAGMDRRVSALRRHL